MSITREELLEAMRNIDATKRLQVSKDEEFLAELAFLSYWDTEITSQTGLSGYSVTDVFDSTENNLPSATIEISHDSGETVNLIYSIDPELPGKLGLIILRSDVVVYARCPYQDPHTEWDINCMANDPEVTDEGGKMLFEGEPVNI